MDLTWLKILIIYIIVSKSLSIIQAIPHAKDILDERILVNFLAMYAALFILTIII